jgi:hypothetical protein
VPFSLSAEFVYLSRGRVRRSLEQHDGLTGDAVNGREMRCFRRPVDIRISL